MIIGVRVRSKRKINCALSQYNLMLTTATRSRHLTDSRISEEDEEAQNESILFGEELK